MQKPSPGWSPIATTIATDALAPGDLTDFGRRILRGLMGLHGLQGAMVAHQLPASDFLHPVYFSGSPKGGAASTATEWARVVTGYQLEPETLSSELGVVCEQAADGVRWCLFLSGITTKNRNAVKCDGAEALRLAIRIEQARVTRDEDRQAKDRLGSIIHATEAGTWEWDVLSGRARMNSRWARIGGRELAELEPITMDTWVSLVHPDDLEDCVQKLESHLAGRSARYEAAYRMRHKDGSWIWVQDRGKVVKLTSEGRPQLMVGSHVDISELKHYEALLEASNADLEERVVRRTSELAVAKQAAEDASRAKDEFLTNISHELRSPLHSILGFTGLALDDMPQMDPGVLRRFIEKSRSSASDLLKLVNDLLDAAKIESGRLVIDPEPCNLRDIIDEVASEFEVAVANKAISVDRDYPDTTMIRVDRSRLGQAIRNLLSNAIRFSPQGGHVGLSVTLPNPRLVKFVVSDEGAGIPEQELDAVFDRFTQSSRTKTGAGGTGLGLPIARGIVEIHGGRLWAERRSPSGSAFCLELPCA